MKLFKILAPTITLTIVADQWSKIWAVETLTQRSIPVIADLFSLTLAYNPGAAFGFMSGLPEGMRQVVLSLAILLALAAIFYMLLRYHRDSALGCFAVGLVLGGAVGNIIDRMRIGVVVDFLDVYWGEYHWPTFNIADSCICVGVAILVFLRTDKVPSEPAAGM